MAFNVQVMRIIISGKGIIKEKRQNNSNRVDIMAATFRQVPAAHGYPCTSRRR
jgi:hypothetical protein